MNWQQFVMDLETLDPDRVEEVLLRHGAHSVTLTDAGDEPVLEPAPGETLLWNDTRITGLFSADADLTAMQHDLMRSLMLECLPRHGVDALEERDWEREWQKDLGPMRFGKRLWVCPSGTEAADGAVVVNLDPGLAFGSGTHPTTAMCLEWLDGLALDGKSVLDYGCGSGVLAIAALKLGAASAVGIDIDPQALAATARHAEYNRVAGRLKLLQAHQPLHGCYDVVVANILAGPLIDVSHAIATRLSSGGELALSGILSAQVDAVRAAYAPWVAFEEPWRRVQDGQSWVRLSGRRLSRALRQSLLKQR